MKQLKAVILAAGKSTRTYPLTVNKPKPLLNLLGKSIIKKNLDALVDFVDEVYVITGFGENLIKTHLGNSYNGITINYITQKKQKGTGHALLMAQNELEKEELFIVMGGDDLYSREDIQSCIESTRTSILSCEVDDSRDFGALEIEGERKTLKKIHEKQNTPVSNVVSTGFCLLPGTIFNLLEKQKESERGEIELTDAINDLAQTEDIYVVKVNEYWLPITYPWSLLEANVFFLNKYEDRFKQLGNIEEHVVIKGNVHIGKGTTIKAHSYIEGPVYIGDNCTIGPFAYIRKDTVIEDNCEIGKMELYDILIMENTTSKHTSYAAHGVIGRNVNIGAGFIMADYRNDGKSHVTLIKGKKVDSKRRKLGAFIGDNVNTGIGTLIYPGRKIWPNLTTLPGEVVTGDKTE